MSGDQMTIQRRTYTQCPFQIDLTADRQHSQIGALQSFSKRMESYNRSFAAFYGKTGAVDGDAFAENNILPDVIDRYFQSQTFAAAYGAEFFYQSGEHAVIPHI